MDCHIEWSKSEKDKYRYDIACIWNIKKEHKWTYQQDRYRVTNVENKPVTLKE